jgi:hypothetical protein
VVVALDEGQQDGARQRRRRAGRVPVGDRIPGVDGDALLDLL